MQKILKEIHKSLASYKAPGYIGLIGGLFWPVSALVHGHWGEGIELVLHAGFTTFMLTIFIVSQIPYKHKN